MMKIVEKLSLYLYGGFEFVFENVERIEFVVVGLSSNEELQMKRIFRFFLSHRPTDTPTRLLPRISTQK